MGVSSRRSLLVVAVALVLAILAPSAAADTSASRPVWPTVAVDSDNKVHAAYDNADGNGIIYATNASGSWVRKRITGGDDRMARIAVDHKGKIHVVFQRTYSDSPRRLFYITNRGGEWTMTKFPWKGYGSTVRLAVDPDRKVHFVFSTDEAAWYATNDSGTWTRERLDVYFGTSPVVAVDPDGFVHLAFGQCAVFDEHQCVDEGIYYRTNRSGAWVQERVSDFQGDRAGSIVADADGHAHIAFDRAYLRQGQEHLGTGLFYLTNESGSWQRHKVGTHGRSGRLAIDHHGFAHVVYRRDHEDFDGVYYATNESGSWVRSAIVQERAIYAEMAIDSRRDLRVVFMRMEIDPGVYYTTNRTGSWTRVELMD